MAFTPYVISIGRQLSAGGRTIGRRLAESLQIQYYDKEILGLAASKSGFSPEVFEETDERKSFFKSIFGTIAPVIGADFYSNQLSDENLFRHISEAIRKEAQSHSCVFIGRCADYILRDHTRAVNIFISADMDDRIERLMQQQNITRKSAIKVIEQGDAGRADFYNFYSNKTWGAADTYDLCVNSSALGLEETFLLVHDFVVKKLHIDLSLLQQP